MTVEWKKFDKTDDVKPQPRRLYWVIEEFYNDGVTVGRYDGGRWEYTNADGNWYDDCLVTHYAEMVFPEGPEA